MAAEGKAAASADAGEHARRSCRRCHAAFDPGNNSPTACRYHPEAYSGETAQRWLDPGDEGDGGKVHYFWTCCGAADRDAAGCCAAAHATFDEPEDWTSGRMPGMGVADEGTRAPSP